MALVVLLNAGCKSETPPKKEKADPAAIADVAEPSTEKSEEKAEQTSGIVNEIPALVTDEVDDLKKLEALRQYNEGIKLQKENRFDESVDALMQSLTANPGHLSARYQLAVSLALKKDPSDAMAVLEQFAAAKDCSRCYVMLARAKENAAFNIFSVTRRFRGLVDGAAERLEKEMAAANWISYNRKSLEESPLTFSFNGIPAISEDGTRILATLQERDAEKRLLSATVQTLDGSTGERRHASRILFETEGRRFISGKMNPREVMRSLDNRISHIHGELVSEKWEPLKLVASESGATLASCGKPQKLQVGDLEVSLSDMQLKITGAGVKSITRDAGEWRLKGQEVCATTPMLRNIYESKTHKTLLIELAFCTDACQSRKSKWTAVRY